MALVGLVLAAFAVAPAAQADPYDPADWAPSVWSDKADYAPGERVTLSGTNWQPGESVHIRVNDDTGEAWSRDVDVVADDVGAITDSFNLPDSFIAQYRVTATGAAMGAVATTTFTDGNVKISVVGGTAPITETLYANAGCSGTIKNGFPVTVTIPPTDTVGVGSSESLRLDAPATANGGQAFLNWSKPTGGGIVFTEIAGTNGRSVCVVGFQSGSEDIVATYAANNAPTVTAANASVTVNEGQTASNSGTYADANPGDDVTISASRGTVTKTGTNSGTWSWSLGTTDGPDQTGPVTVTANDGNGGTASTTFQLIVNNVAPTTTLAAGNPLSVSEGSTQRTYSYTISDPGADTVTSVTTSCGASGVKVVGSDTNTNTAGSFKCTFADGPSTSVVSVSATDSDGATGNLATQSVTVNNVAPTVTLTGPATADEGETKSYSFTVTDPGADTFAVEAGFPDCDAGATNNGSFVAGSLSVNAGGGTFQCSFPDGPSMANVKMQIRDSDGASDAASQSVQIVAVANVAPTVVLSGDVSANEGQTKTYTYTVSDPGDDPTPAIIEDCGSNATKTNTAAVNSFDCTFTDGPGSSTVKVTADDGDATNNIGSDSKTVSVANVAPTVVLSGDVSANEGQTKTYTYTVTDPGADPNPTIIEDCGANATKTNTAAVNSFDCTFPDGPASSTVKVTANDGDPSNNIGSDQKIVTIANVDPDITSFTGTPSFAGPLAFVPSVFKTDFTDPGRPTDTHKAEFTWGDTPTPTTQSVNPFVSGQLVTHTFAAGCGRTASVKVIDKDNGFDTASTTVNVGTGAWLPPLANQPVSDKLRNGQVLPVKVRLTDCTGATVNGLSPYIEVVKGDLTSVADDGVHTIDAQSVSSSDTDGIMRPMADGSYIYNLRVNLPAGEIGKDWTIIVYPYGKTPGAGSMRHVIVATK